MRGGDGRSGKLFSYVDLEARVRTDHPLRAIRSIVNVALTEMEREFGLLYAPIGRPSIPPEKLLRAMLLQAFYSIRSERQLMERLEFDLLFRWFVGLGIDDAVWDHSTFSKNRDRLLEGDIAAKFLAAVLGQKLVKRLLSSEHFSVDGTLIEAWASMKSFKPRDGSDEPPPDGGRNAETNFRGEKRSNATHASTTDPDARLYRKGSGKEAKLCFIGHGLMENRSGLLVAACLTRADGRAERVAALAMIEPYADRPRAITLGGDKGFDAEDFVMSCGRCGSRRMWRKTPGADDRRSMDAPPAVPVTGRANASVSASRRRLAGSKPWPGSARPSSAGATASDGPSPLRRPPTTWCGCPSSWQRRDEATAPPEGALADR